MWILEPGKLAEKDEDWLLNEGYMHAQKVRMDFALASASTIPDQSTLSGVVDFIRAETGILLSNEGLLQILSLYPAARGILAVDGWGDTQTRDLVLDVVANFMANTRWPKHGDNVDIHAFAEQLQAAARFMGYTTTNKL